MRRLGRWTFWLAVIGSTLTLIAAVAGWTYGQYYYATAIDHRFYTVGNSIFDRQRIAYLGRSRITLRAQDSRIDTPSFIEQQPFSQVMRSFTAAPYTAEYGTPGRWAFAYTSMRPGPNATLRELYLPYWAVVALAAPLPAIGATRIVGAARRVRRRWGGRCVECGYDLRGSDGRCPECGRAIAA